jgi:predicted ester cyclase
MSDQVYQAISDQHRREILRLIQDRELSAGEIARHFEVAQPAISQHLRVLHEAQLVTFVAAFPDSQTRTDHLVAERDKVIDWYSAYSTNTGSFMGAPPTDKKFDIVSVVVYRIDNGKILETWGINDQMGLMQQLGMMEVSP